MSVMTQSIPESSIPLAERMRPRSISEVIGQPQLLRPDTAFSRALHEGRLHSSILWGPPGTGKTTLARLLAKHTQADFIALSAVMSGVKEIRAALEQGRHNLQQQKRTILFIDEIHRFNKSQQDAFLHAMENGEIILIGATTENPSFALNNALLSRARVYILKSLDEEALTTLLRRALNDPERGISLKVSDEVLKNIARMSSGDARCALNQLETLSDLKDDKGELDDETANRYLHKSLGHFDKNGDTFYDQISALHKSIRGSDPDAALFWLTSMLQSGCDPFYLARRLVRVASEDIGNADPRALQLALNAWEVMERLGSPEGELALAQATLYLASIPKSNAVYMASKKAAKDIQEIADYDVPTYLRNAPTALMKSLGYGKAYRYAHDEPDAFAAGECYFPEGIKEREYYQPVSRGMESKIKERLDYLKSLNHKARAC